MSNTLTIDSLVKSYIADKGEPTLHNYLSYLQAAFQANQEFNLSAGHNVKLAKLEVAGNYTAQYPADMVTWSRIGVQVGDRFALIGRDESIFLASPGDASTDPYVEEGYAQSGYVVANFVPDTLANEAYANQSNYKGVGYNSTGYVRDDVRNSRFQFEVSVQTDRVYLEYHTSGYTVGDTTLIPRAAEQAYKAYIDYKMSLKKRGHNSGETQMAKLAYQQLLDQAVKRMTPFGPEDVYDVILKVRRGYMSPMGERDGPIVIPVDNPSSPTDPTDPTDPPSTSGIFDNTFDSTFS